MFGLYAHRIVTGFLVLLTAVAFGLGFVALKHTRADHKKLNLQAKKIAHQADVIDALVSTADAQGTVNRAMLKALQSMNARQRQTETRSLAGVYP